jgi:putative redox protein
MPTETVRADWIEEQVFLLRDQFGFPVVMTQPMGVNGADLLPMSLIGCAAWDVMAILKKQRQQVVRLEVTADSQRDEDPPWRYRKIHILYRFTGRGLSPEKVQRAIELSQTKYCSIYVTLRDVVEITSDFEIVNDPG